MRFASKLSSASTRNLAASGQDLVGDHRRASAQLGRVLRCTFLESLGMRGYVEYCRIRQWREACTAERRAIAACISKSAFQLVQVTDYDPLFETTDEARVRHERSQSRGAAVTDDDHVLGGLVG